MWTDVLTDDAQAATVQPAGPRVHFVDDAKLTVGCPSEGPACRSSAYLTPGDVVLMGRIEGTYACAAFVGSRGETTVGWLPRAALLPSPRTEPADWAGQWMGEQRITISPSRDGAMAVSGEATGGRDHIGQVAGEARPQGSVLAFTMGEDRTLAYEKGDEDDCRIRLWRRGPYLLARDNGGCGGASVSFSGFYRR